MLRRTFLKNSLAASSSLVLQPHGLHVISQPFLADIDDKIRKLGTTLLEQWCMGLYAQQTRNTGDLSTSGGIYSPGDDAYLGRSADAIYPFLWMANHSGEEKYIEAALQVYAWEQNNCWNETYGCWYNDPGKPDGWKSISVFSALTKVESIEHYPQLLGEKTIREWKERLELVADYLFRTFHIDYANINYPASATIALFKLGKMFNEEKYVNKANQLAEGIMSYFTPEGLFFGEGGRKVSNNGQYPVDLGYNVEESLPSLAQYSVLSGNNVLYKKVMHSMKVHLMFMLPNGSWDNSWGTRSFKWTVWGSRTSDGCFPGYFLMADEAPEFAEAVYRNLQCMKTSTWNMLLQSGPHEHLAMIAPSTHHTFDHAKALTSLLNMKAPEIINTRAKLPREKEYGIRKFNDINTLLFSKGPWRGTVTAYSVPYKETINGHPSGGALSCLYHTQLGMISASSMIEYKRWEKHNMIDKEKVENFMDLTPRLELVVDEEFVFRNINDLQSELTSHEGKHKLAIATKSRLLNGYQESPSAGTVTASINYTVKVDSVTIELEIDKKPMEGKLHFIFPLVCSSLDRIEFSNGSFSMRNAQGSICIKSNYVLQKSLPLDKRVYNFIPGLQAYPIDIECPDLHEKKLLLHIEACTIKTFEKLN